jgi:hypothetical protein
VHDGKDKNITKFGVQGYGKLIEQVKEFQGITAMT